MISKSIIITLAVAAIGVVAVPGPEAVVQVMGRASGVEARQYQKVCKDWEIGVGTFEDCPNFSCTGEHATIFTSNCNDRLSINWDSDNICGDGYSRDGYYVECSNGRATRVRNSKGETFGDCYKPNNSGNCNGIPGINNAQQQNVQFCCPLHR